MAYDPEILVEQWIKKQDATTPLLPSIIARELDDLNPLAVAEALASLSMGGKIVPAFAVRVPSGVVLRKVYRSLNDIEPEVRDSFNRVIPRDDLEVLPVYAKAGR